MPLPAAAWGDDGRRVGRALRSLGAVAVTERDRNAQAAGECAEELTRADQHDAGRNRVHPVGAQLLAERTEDRVVDGPCGEDRHKNGHSRGEGPRRLDGQHLVEHLANYSERERQAHEHDERVHLCSSFAARGAPLTPSSTPGTTLGYSSSAIFFTGIFLTGVFLDWAKRQDG